MTSDPHDTPSAEQQASTTWPNSIPKWVGVGLFIYLSVFALGFAQLFLVPVVLAFLLSMVFSPIRRFMNRRGISQG